MIAPVQTFASAPIFLSHSGQRSRDIAEFLRSWLAGFSDIHPGFGHVWMDRFEINPGREWSPQLHAALAESRAGIVCCTPENADAAWPIAEFACLWQEGRTVVPYLAGEATRDRLPEPMKAASPCMARDKQDTLNMLFSLAGPDLPPESARALRERFEAEWPKLERFLTNLGASPVREAVFDDPGMEASGTLVKSWVEAIARYGPLKTVRVKVLMERSIHICAVIGALALGAGALAFTPWGNDFLKKVVNALSEPKVSPQPVSSSGRVEELTRTLGELRGRYELLQASNEWFAGTLKQLEQANAELSAAAKREKKADFGAEDSPLEFLPPQEINLRGLLLSSVVSLPAEGDWLVFVPTGPPVSVFLHSTPQGGVRSGAIRFGLPYRVSAVAQPGSLSIELAASTGAPEGGWLQEWAPGKAFVALRAPDGLKIPNWRFVPAPDSVQPDLLPQSFEPDWQQSIDYAEAGRGGQFVGGQGGTAPPPQPNLPSNPALNPGAATQPAPPGTQNGPANSTDKPAAVPNRPSAPSRPRIVP